MQSGSSSNSGSKVFANCPPNRKTGLFLFFTLFLAIPLFPLLSCNQSGSGNEPIDSTYQYLFVGHPRVWKRGVQEVDPVVAGIDFSQFRVRMIGGDVTDSASKRLEILEYINSVFDIRDENTLWTLGNHDYDNVEYLTRVTERPTFYAHYRDKITFLVIDTQDSLCYLNNAQMDMIRNVCDTLSVSKNLVLISHKFLWLHGHPELEPFLDSIPNRGLGRSKIDVFPNNFHSEVYPLLEKVRKNGVEVFCIAGDMGVKVHEFHYETAPGIHFLGSGISNQNPKSKVLIFSQDMETNKLTWRYKLLNEFK